MRRGSGGSDGRAFSQITGRRRVDFIPFGHRVILARFTHERPAKYCLSLKIVPRMHGRSSSAVYERIRIMFRTGVYYFYFSFNTVSLREGINVYNKSLTVDFSNLHI